jgi:hypothetical protein
VFAFMSMSLWACREHTLEVPIGDVLIPTKIINLDSIFVNESPTDLKTSHQIHQQKFPEIYSYELGHCLGLSNLNEESFVESIGLFVKDDYIKRVEKDIHDLYSKLPLFNREMLDGFKRLRYHFPEGKIPNYLVYMNSLFASNAFCTENEIGIGLERYLGDSLAVIKELPPQQFFDWIKAGMDSRYLTRDVMVSWLMTHYLDVEPRNLAEGVVNWGKILYLTKAAYPAMEDHLILRYKKEGYDWAIKNEYGFWDYLVKEKLLFKDNERDQMNMLKEGPFTPGLPTKGPDRLGQFLGYQMVKRFMEENDIPLIQLIETDYAEILKTYKIED